MKQLSAACAALAVFLLSCSGALWAANKTSPSALTTISHLSADQVKAIDDIVTQTMQAQNVPGISLAIAHGSDILYAKGYGFRDVSAALPVEMQTYFPVSSLTKEFTAAAVGLLAQAGNVSLDDPIARYVPAAPHGAEITVWQLMSQTSGLEEFLARPGVKGFLTSRAVRAADLYDLVADLPLKFAPGARFDDSNTNFIILGLIIEGVSGKSYANFVRSYLLNNTPYAGIFYGPPTSGDVTNGYDAQNPVVPLTMWSPALLYAAGALYAKAVDLTRWDDAFFGGQIVSASTLARLTTPRPLTQEPGNRLAAPWTNTTIDGHRVIWQGGGIPGSHARNAYFPEQHLSVVILGNAQSLDETAIVTEILRTYLTPTAEQRSAQLRPTSGEDPKITALARDLYTALRSGKVDRSAFNDAGNTNLTDDILATLAAQLSNQGVPTAFVYSSKTTSRAGAIYRYRVVTPVTSMLMTFAIDTVGKITGITVKP